MAKQIETVANYLTLKNHFQQGQFAPVILLQGDEVYFIDDLTNLLESLVLNESEKSFNQTIVYGKETKTNDLVGMARRYPMMSKYQLIVVKDAQELKDLDKLEAYLENPLPSTVLVLAFRGSKIDARTRFAKLCSKHILYTADKLRDYQIKEWLPNFLRMRGRSIDTQAVNLLLDYLGSELGIIQNELEKVMISVKEEFIKVSHIEAHVGFNREYNVFELQNALGQRNFNKSVQIAHQMGKKSDKGELMRVSSTLMGYFSKILVLKNSAVTSEFEAAKILGVNPFFVKDYVTASRNFRLEDLEVVFNLLKLMDLRMKGVHRGAASDGDILLETVLGVLRVGEVVAKY
ncbi:MAG: DNA polymerase III subunit delta [Bacteroidota bacterium]|jgi:DNA polymerase-3 subunit delta